MKVLLIKPMEHPQVVDIENSLKEFYRILDCDCITATSRGKNAPSWSPMTRKIQ